MSRIGKQPVQLPDGVHAEVREREVIIDGPLGKLSVPVPDVISVANEGSTIQLSLLRDTKQAPALWGLTRALLANAARGVSKGFSQKLILEGIGYRANMEGETLNLSLGFSHPVHIEPPPGIKFTVEKNVVTVSGFDKQVIGNVAASIRRLRPPEPYKGKGIRKEGEIIRRKAGKKAAAAAK